MAVFSHNSYCTTSNHQFLFHLVSSYVRFVDFCHSLKLSHLWNMKSKSHSMACFLYLHGESLFNASRNQDISVFPYLCTHSGWKENVHSGSHLSSWNITTYNSNKCFIFHIPSGISGSTYTYSVLQKKRRERTFYPFVEHFHPPVFVSSGIQCCEALATNCDRFQQLYYRIESPHWKTHPNPKSMHMWFNNFDYHCSFETIIIIEEQYKNEGIWNSISDKRRNIWMKLQNTSKKFPPSSHHLCYNYTRSVGCISFS